MILLPAAALIFTAILVITGFILAVVALLAAQRLTVATVALVAMALVSAVLKGIALISAFLAKRQLACECRSARRLAHVIDSPYSHLDVL
jgi:hypothetical protein